MTILGYLAIFAHYSTQRAKTHWFAMHCVDDKKMAPQKDEGIKKVEWMDMEEVRKALHGSYRSIRYVMQEYTKDISESSLT